MYHMTSECNQSPLREHKPYAKGLGDQFRAAPGCTEQNASPTNEQACRHHRLPNSAHRNLLQPHIRHERSPGALAYAPSPQRVADLRVQHPQANATLSCNHIPLGLADTQRLGLEYMQISCGNHSVWYSPATESIMHVQVRQRQYKIHHLPYDCRSP
jgi:hypothetical protein